MVATSLSNGRLYSTTVHLLAIVGAAFLINFGLRLVEQPAAHATVARAQVAASQLYSNAPQSAVEATLADRQKAVLSPPVAAAVVSVAAPAAAKTITASADAPRAVAPQADRGADPDLVLNGVAKPNPPRFDRDIAVATGDAPTPPSTIDAATRDDTPNAGPVQAASSSEPAQAHGSERPLLALADTQAADPPMPSFSAAVTAVMATEQTAAFLQQNGGEASASRAQAATPAASGDPPP